MTHMMEEILQQPMVLKNCLETNLPALISLVGEIRRSSINLVCIAARGTSDHAGIYAKYLFESMLGLPVMLAASSVVTMYGKSVRFTNQTMVIGISQSGQAADVLAVLSDAASQGALTVSITNFPGSPIALATKHSLYCSAGIEKSVAATKTFTAQLYLLAWLAAELDGKNNLKPSLLQIPDDLSKMLSRPSVYESTAMHYRNIQECFVLARGINYPIALETALKIQETTYTRAKAFAISDFQHGPIAMLRPDIPVLVLAPNGPSLADSQRILRRLRETGMDILLFSNNDELLAQADHAFSIPNTQCDAVSAFYNVVAAQLFACYLAKSKGLNPDAPRMLKKVTITK
jgi:glucosamine--fructose-6-phosphate aminotransferase (isomerizing)